MSTIDRLSIRQRPAGTPVMHQTWRKLLFLHWRVKPALLRPLIPPELEIDTFEGEAWVGITPFTMTGLRPTYLPAVPFLSQTHEINVRTYVVHRGVPGIWFFSLDASNPLAVAGARLTFRLPYFQARMGLTEEGNEVRFYTRRSGGPEPRPELRARWRRQEPLPEAQPGSLDFFLVERYCLYAADSSGLYRARIHHRPWPLHAATCLLEQSTMLSAQGIPHEPHEPLIHAQGEALHVRVWPLEKV